MAKPPNQDDGNAAARKETLAAHAEEMGRLAASLNEAFAASDDAVSSNAWPEAGGAFRPGFAAASLTGPAQGYAGPLPPVHVHFELSRCLNDPSLAPTDPISKYDVNGPNSAPPYIAGRVQAWPPFAYYHVQLFPADFLTLRLMQNVEDRIATRLWAAGARVAS